MTDTIAPSWKKIGTSPENRKEWLERAQEVAAVLAEDAAERDRANEKPDAEVALLKDSGLVTLMGPLEHGGGGGNWITAYRVIREVAKADGSIGQLLGYHYLWSQMPRMWGTPEQWERMEAESTAQRWLWAGAVNPRDDDLVVRDAGDCLVFNGHKGFSTGNRVSDITVLEGIFQKSEDYHVFATVPSTTPGLVPNGDWYNMGQRLTESGGVEIQDVRANWPDALGFVNKEFVERAYNTLTLPAIQLVFINFYLGIAQGALEEAAKYTPEKTRPWLFAEVDRAVDDPYILENYGDMYSQLLAVEALVDRAGDEIQKAHDDAHSLTERWRGEIAEFVAAAKIRSTKTALDVTSRIFEVTGARATASKYGMDRFWRNVRTHTLHDPVSYKLREVGVFALRDEIPEPTWYT